MSARIGTVAKHILADLKQEVFRPNRACNVLDSYIAYVERIGTDSDKCIVFLHGNPTNSYLWRKVLQEVEGKVPHRLLCPDLIGFGRSGDSQRGYGFFAHYAYLSAWFDQVVTERNVVLCVQDWGSALGFHWSRHNQHKIRGVVHMESIVGPLESWEEFPAPGRKAFQTMREVPGAGESMIFEKNFFVEKLLLGESWSAGLGEQGVAPYRERFNSMGNRLPTLEWPRQIAIKNTNSPQEVVDAAVEWNGFLKESAFPKLFIPASPGFFTPWVLEKVKTWNNNSIGQTVKGLHFVQEDSGEAIGQQLLQFVQGLPSK